MSTIDVTNQLIGMQNATSQMKAANSTTGTSEINSDTFLQLMMEQLKYQDPLDPVSNQDFIAQQAQFTQLSTIQEMNDNMSSNNTIMQTLSLVGKEVTLTDPSDAKKTITGTVDEAKFTSDGSSIMVGGKEYPLTLVQSVKQPAAAPATAATTGTNPAS